MPKLRLEAQDPRLYPKVYEPLVLHHASIDNFPIRHIQNDESKFYHYLEAPSRKRESERPRTVRRSTHVGSRLPRQPDYVAAYPVHR
jgi:hypothetical protein